MHKKVFIGIPTLNRPDFVRETIKSILAQTYQGFRIIVSDNNSEEKAVESVKKFILYLNDDRISFHRQETNVGEYGQGKFFFTEASEYEFFVILHDDDVLKPNYLGKGIDVLTNNPFLAYFVANPFLMDEKGKVSDEDTETYLSAHGRKEKADGEIEVLNTHLQYGFTPISGTLFRLSALKDSGFVDSDCHGLYPFECNVFLRLGERGAKAWFCSEELLGFRFHSGSMRNYLNTLENTHVVETMIRLFAKRRFSGANERRRRQILSRLYRARTLIRLKNGDKPGCRYDMLRALKQNIFSPRAWAMVPFVLLIPGFLKILLPDLPEQRDEPYCRAIKAAGSSLQDNV